MRWIDTFLFNGDTIAQLRLQYLYPHVDKFYIVEQRYTHQGTRKEQLYFDLYKDWFEPYKRKIVMMVDETNYLGDTWKQENTHRNFAVQRILEDNKGCNYIVSVCDCDEIPDVEVVKANLETLYKQCSGGAVYMRQHFFYYNFHWHISMWHKAFFVNDVLLSRHPNFQLFRNKEGPVSEYKMINCGWHCSFFTSAQEILRKVTSFAHSEYNTPLYKNLEFIQKCIREGMDLFMRQGECNFQRDFIPLDKLPNEFRFFQRYLDTLQV